MDLTARMNRAVTGAKRSAIREFNRLARETPGCISLTLGEPDFDTPVPVRAAAAAALEAGETHYIENNGYGVKAENVVIVKNGLIEEGTEEDFTA